MHPTDELLPILKKLRLSGLLQSLELRVRQAADEAVTPSEFLLRLLSDEVERRDSTQLDHRLRRASFEHARTLEDFDFACNPQVPRAKILELATCAFVGRRENLCIVGQTGVGKSHIAQALEWPPLFLDPLLAGAALDRLLHHGDVITLEGESYRNPKRKKPTKVTP